MAKLLESVERERPQSFGADVGWIADTDGSFVLRDSLRVAKYVNQVVLWCTPRISLDGIILDSIDENVVRGPSSQVGAYEITNPFVLSRDTGELLEGEKIEW